MEGENVPNGLAKAYKEYNAPFTYNFGIMRKLEDREEKTFTKPPILYYLS